MKIMKTIIVSGVALSALAGVAFAQDFTVNGGASKIAGSGGKELYNRICSACHMRDGSGAQGAGAYPALAGNEKLEDPGYPLYVMMHGQKAMPPLRGVLTDEQAAEILNYVRTELNSYEGLTTPEEVKEVREAN